MKPAKKQVSFRLAEQTIKEIKDIAKRQGVADSDVITVLVRLYYSGEDFDNAENWFNIARIS